jgi:hypothetical protein
MSKGPWRRPTLTLIDRAIRAVEKAGLSVSQLKIEPDGTIVVGTPPVPQEPPDNARPNSFDQVLGPN